MQKKAYARENIFLDILMVILYFSSWHKFRNVTAGFISFLIYPRKRP